MKNQTKIYQIQKFINLVYDQSDIRILEIKTECFKVNLIKNIKEFYSENEIKNILVILGYEPTSAEIIEKILNNEVEYFIVDILNSKLQENKLFNQQFFFQLNSKAEFIAEKKLNNSISVEEIKILNDCNLNIAFKKIIENFIFKTQMAIAENRTNTSIKMKLHVLKRMGLLDLIIKKLP